MKDYSKVLVALEATIFVAALLIYGLKLANYFGIEGVQSSTVTQGVASVFEKPIQVVKNSKYTRRCPKTMKKIEVNWSYVCREETEPNAYVVIFDTYDKLGNGREKIYAEAVDGDLAVAKLMLEQNKYDFQRNEPTTIVNPQWNEDPYSDRYWRFNYYGLSIINDLLYANKETGDPRYIDKANEIIRDFAHTGTQVPHAWDDDHAVAFRSITLVNYWWQTRERDLLDIQVSNTILALLEQHGDFLADRSHYEASNNHGINEIAALYVLSNAFPTLPRAQEWRLLSEQRLESNLQDLVDTDGALIENSPFYHFYAMRKYWNIYTYAQQHNLPITPLLKQKIDKMVEYATYILQPNSHPPTIGASLDSQIYYNDDYREMAQSYPELKYVLTQGEYGKKPAKRNVFYADMGQAIMRSDFGRDFTQQTHVIFQAADFRSAHSHLDALSLTVTEGNQRLLVDPGLYAYEPSAVTDYFQGTSAHNTVMVDGKNQHKGPAELMSYAEGSDFATATGAHELYEGVTHSRSVSYVDKKTIVVIDNLVSESDHTYTQLFHFAPGAQVRSENSGVVRATYPGRKQPVTIRQILPVHDATELVTDRQEAPVGGLCSDEYKTLLTCTQVNFEKTGKSATFVTVIELDTQTRAYTLNNDGALTLAVASKDFVLKTRPVERRESVLTSASPVGLAANAPIQPNVAFIMKNGNMTMDYILPVLQRYGHKASVTIPTEQIAQNYPSIVTTAELKKLQQVYGWDLISQPFNSDRDLSQSVKPSDIVDYEEAIIRESAMFQGKQLVTSPNWFYHSSAALSPEMREIAKKYYTFGLSGIRGVESLPGADSLVLKTFSVGDATTLPVIQAAVDSAVANNQTLFLVFTRFKKTTDPAVSGFNTTDFDKLAAYVASKDITAKTLTEMNKSLGLSVAPSNIKVGHPQYVAVDITAQPKKWWQLGREKIQSLF